jgi:hypothetical protein
MTKSPIFHGLDEVLNLSLRVSFRWSLRLKDSFERDIFSYEPFVAVHDAEKNVSKLFGSHVRILSVCWTLVSRNDSRPAHRIFAYLSELTVHYRLDDGSRLEA